MSTYETGWCIEHEDSPAGRPLYLTLVDGQIGWSYDSIKAFRMARLEDGKCFVKVFLGDASHLVAEHGWGP